MMRALVTGGAGFIGSNLADQLVADGAQVVVVDNLSSGRREQVPAGAELIVEDIANPSLVEIVERAKADVIFHLAAQIDVRRSMADPGGDVRINVQGSLHVLEGARRAGTRRVVFASTGGAIYGDGVPLPAAEDAHAAPISVYGASKLSVEKYLGVYHATHGLPYAAMRFANVYGPRQDPHGEAGVVAIFAERLLRGEPCKVYGDGLQTRDYVFVEDVVDACTRAARAEGAGIFNVGTGTETNVLELYEALRGLAGATAPPQMAPARPGEQLRSCIDSSFAARELGWRPTHSLIEGLRKTWDWFRARG